MLKISDGVKVGFDIVPGELEATFDRGVVKASELRGRERERTTGR